MNFMVFKNCSELGIEFPGQLRTIPLEFIGNTILFSCKNFPFQKFFDSEDVDSFKINLFTFNKELLLETNQEFSEVYIRFNFYLAHLIKSIGVVKVGDLVFNPLTKQSNFCRRTKESKIISNKEPELCFYKDDKLIFRGNKENLVGEEFLESLRRELREMERNTEFDDE